VPAGLFYFALPHIQKDDGKMAATSRNSAAQVALAKQAAALKASAGKTTLSPALAAAQQQSIIEAGFTADIARGPHDKKHAHGARAPPAVRLLFKWEVLEIVGVSYPTLWLWMREGRFPRPRVVGRGGNSKSVWRSDEIDVWLNGLQLRKLKGDTPTPQPRLSKPKSNPDTGISRSSRSQRSLTEGGAE
jgi:predicted DNA-binding transcriptional regulator AlpA